MINSRQDRGAVSLFVVIFSAMLMTIVTVGFLQIMLKDQQQATAVDLSQSAYDSAQAGVEDAKRLLLLAQACEHGSAASGVNCENIENAVTPLDGRPDTECDTLAAAGLVSQTSDEETIIQQSDGDDALNQAYTCVKITMDTADYKGDVSINSSQLVPLSGVSEFDSIEISWFAREDMPNSEGSLDIDFPTSGADTSLPRVGSSWQDNSPAMLRAQLIQTGSSFELSDFNDSQGGGSNSNSLFLYPSATGIPDLDFALDGRRDRGGGPEQVLCQSSLANTEYACSVRIDLPDPIDGSEDERQAFLRLGALYNDTHYNIQLFDGSSLVRFDGVQPKVDSTGRANDMFRRVESRIELQSAFTYPEAAVDIVGDLCKNFIVTDEEGDYNNSSTCDP